MTDEARGTHGPDDAELLNLVRAGDASAFGVLRGRHEEAARRLAGELLDSAAVADEVVAETFARVLAAMQRGGGPADAFRPYLLTAVRRVARDQLAGGSYGQLRQTDPGELLIDPAVAGLETGPVARGFLSLPDRWVALLWHTDVEESAPADVAPLLGLTRDDVAAQRRRARDGLRQACLQAHAASVVGEDCQLVAGRLGAFIQDAVSEDSAMVTDHLAQCDQCRAVYSELADVGLALRTAVAPLFLGGATAAYLSGPRTAGAAVPDAPVPGAAGAASGLFSRAGLRQRLARSSRASRWLAAGAVATVIAAIALAVALTGQNAPAAPVGRVDPVAGTPVAPEAADPSPAISPARHLHHHHGKPKPAHSSSPAATPSPSKTPPPDQLTVSVNMYGVGQDWQGAQVEFGVTDTGTAASGELTVTLTLPAGTSVLGGSQQPAPSAGLGWSCVESGSKATCEHSGISAGGSVQGTIFLSVSSSSACGQAVAVTASSGPATASGTSAQSVEC